MHRGLKAVVGAAMALTVALATADAAGAETVQNDGSDALVTQPTADGFGEAYVWWVDASGNPVSSKTVPAYAKADLYDYQTGYTMDGWLQRSTDGGKNWTQVSGTHALNSTLTTNQEQGTDPYYD